MIAKKIIYERLYNLGNFSHEKIGIEVEITGDENPSDALDRAKAFCRLNSTDLAIKLEKAKAIVANKDGCYFGEVEEAQKTIFEYESDQSELPF